MSNPFLVVIDVAPLEAYFKNYFNLFNITIITKTDIYLPIESLDKAKALLIDCSVLNNEKTLITQLYEQYLGPLLITGLPGNEDFCINLLGVGADDFLIKPLNPREVHARIMAINRRILRANPSFKTSKELFTFAHWRVYPSSRKIFNPLNQELFLSVGEYELLLIFIQHPQQVLTREFLLQLVKNSDFNPLDRRIDIQISRLRKKLENDTKKPKLITTIRNGGYMFTTSVSRIQE